MWRNRYLVGLDPSYMQLFDGDLYNLWVAITRGQFTDPGQIISIRFRTRYVFSDRAHDAFLEIAENDRSMHLVYQDDQTVFFEISSTAE